MADPTLEELQQQIDELKSLITTQYEPPSGSEYSYPVVNQPMNDEQWQYVTLAMGDGILDTGGSPYWLKKLDTDAETNQQNQMVLTVSWEHGNAQGLLRGFFHRLMQDKVLNFPGVTTKTTYYVVLQYDPQGHAGESGPIVAKVVTNLDYSQGKHYVVLWTVEREPNQLLTDATITRLRPRVSPSFYVWDESHRPAANKVLWGTICYVGRTGKAYRSSGPDGADAANREWVLQQDSDLSALAPDIVPRGDGSGYEYPGTGARLKSTRVGNVVIMEGRVQRESGAQFLSSNADGYYIRTLPAAHRPENERRFITKSDGVGSTSRSAVVVVSSNGEVRVWPNQNCSWVSVDGCVFTVVG